jgi:hypothetical protein
VPLYDTPADTTPPDTSITSAPVSATNATSASFGFTSTEPGSTFACKLDGPGSTTGSYTACTSPMTYGGGTPLADGIYKFSVRATDLAGNTDATPATRSFTVDTTAPDTTITSAPASPTNDSSVSFGFSSNQAGSTFACKLDGPGSTTGSYAACISPTTYGSTTTPLTAGTYTFSVRATDAAGNTDPTPAARTFTVDPTAPVVISAGDASRAYGAADPQFGYTTSGLLGDDTLTTPPTCTSTATSSSPVGTYPITCTGADAGSKYAISYTPGTLTITKAAVVVTPDSASIVYGDPDPAFTYTTTGLVGGDHLTTPASCGVTGAHTSAGSYPITCTGADAGRNYTVSYGPGTLTVTKAPGVITPDPQTVTYGDPDPKFTFTVSGIKPGDSLASDPTCGVSGAHAAAGTYTITCAGGSAGDNYTLSYRTATLTVDKAKVTITADNQSKTYGENDPAFTYTTSGLIAGEHLTTPATCDVSGAHTNAGDYSITCAGADAGNNYTISYDPGTLTVGKAQLSITAADATRPYGAADPPFTATTSGFVNGDTAATAYTGSPTLGTSATTTSHVGTYPITPTAGTLASTNYTFTFVPGTLTITKATTSISPGAVLVTVGPGGLFIRFGTLSATMTYGTPAHAAVGETIVFSLYGRTLCTATTDAHGTATCQITALQTVLVAFSFGYTATFTGSQDLDPTSAHGRLIKIA